MNSTGEFARTCSGEGGRERQGLSAQSPSPRAKHPNPRSRNHERPWIHAKPRRPPEHGGERKWMTPFHTPQAEAEGYETEILTKLHSNPKNRMRKPQTYNCTYLCGSLRAMNCAHDMAV